MTAAATPAVELIDAVKRYGDAVALDHVSLTVHAGEFFCLLGPSGCGKTTTLNLVGGFIVTAAGDHVLYALTACTALVGGTIAWRAYGWMDGSGPSTRSSALASTGASERA